MRREQIKDRQDGRRGNGEEASGEQAALASSRSLLSYCGTVGRPSVFTADDITSALAYVTSDRSSCGKTTPAEVTIKRNYF